MKEEFNKEEFMAACCLCGCDRPGREAILEGIESFKDSNPVLSKQLTYYRDDLFKKDKKDRAYRKHLAEVGSKELNRLAAEALRAMADKLEEPGMHFMIHCTLPNMPIFSGKNFYEEYGSAIDITIVRGPLGG